MSRYNDLWLRIVRNTELLELLIELDVESWDRGLYDEALAYYTQAQDLMVHTEELFEQLKQEPES
jgi:hypothetical protein